MTFCKDSIVSFTNVSKNFGNVRIVHDLTFDIPAGNVYGFLGAIGSGKTTALKMIAGLLKPSSGTGLCLGYDIEKERDKLRYKIGYLPQHFNLYSELTVYENLKLICDLYLLKNHKNIIEHNIHLFSLEKYTKYLAKDLSGGWKRRLSLAAAFIHNPKLLILDEPTAGIDPASRIEIWNLIYNYAITNTVIVSTHYMDEAERCRQICYLSHGFIKFIGEPQHLILHLKLKTYIIWNVDFNFVQESLAQLPFTKKVFRFGNKIHWCIKDSEVERAHEYLEKNKYKNWQSIPTSLEEAIIIKEEKVYDD